MMAVLGFFTGNLWRTAAIALLVACGWLYVQKAYYSSELANVKLQTAEATAKAEKEAREKLVNQQAAHDKALENERTAKDTARAKAAALLAQLNKLEDYNAKLAFSLRTYLNGMYDTSGSFTSELLKAP